MKTIILGILMLISSSALVAAQPTCNDQFDFWIGEWDVVDYGSNTPVGKNLIRRIHGCTLEENWVGRDGDTGTSLNTYRQNEKQWHQIWVNTNGAFLHLIGEFKDNKMILIGEATRPFSGAVLLNRVTWSVVNNNPNQVRQYWEVSSDAGKTWSVDFDGLYKRRSP
jgi:hypothetical protein